ncbi:cytochrome c oxidase subunit 2 [Lacibacter cauensis]|uniref:Cytochrome c oxidase subunit 2 n=1 Tax=Lacibacter cauensis TaxID=510947 RepID=A0A562SQ09_9BACT|nr:cytochrome c oxidase subunit II [Lacibacter cauensis]TWI83104.1 cytochrome c oxidase subunit 2 [Lacibacter cauensis]
MTTTTYLIIAAAVLVFIVIFQIAKASEYVSVLKGEETSRKQNNRINGFMLLGFMIVGFIAVYYCNKLLYKTTLFPQGSASVEGEKFDEMFMITTAVTGLVFVITQFLLFFFAWKYQEKEGRKAFYFPHNNKLELVWTVVPAIFLTVLVVFGLRFWFRITSDAPKGALEVEIVGKQFGWMMRYPGKDKIFGKTYFRVISDANSNPFGQIFEDNEELKLKADPTNFDDVVTTQTMYIVKGRPVKLIIGSRDVIHDVGLNHFRLKMDAVPGIPTTLWFTPKYTTKEMKERTGNPNFVYEIACDQMCGNGHYSMKGIIEVVTQEEFDIWMAKQKPNYYLAFPDKDPSAIKPAADSTAAVTAADKNAVAINK